MDWGGLIGPAVVAAFVSGVISIVGVIVNRSTTIKLHSDKLEADRLLAQEKVRADIDLARSKFDYDRRQAIFRRRFELAEQLLSDTYRFKDMMRYVRNGVSFGGEGKTRSPTDHESEGTKRARDSYFVPLERLNAEGEFIASMFARRTTCQAHFGSEIDRAFNLLHEALHLVRVASSLLVQWTDDKDRADLSTMEKLRRDIWQSMAEHAGKDEIGEKIVEAGKIVEDLCQPVLAWVDK